MSTEQLLLKCPPVSQWSTDPRENARIAPEVDPALHPFMASFARQRDDISGKLKSSGTAPGQYRLETNQALDGNDLPDGCVLTFMAHADSALFQGVIVNDGPPLQLFTEQLEMGPRWLRKGGIYTIVFDRGRCIWVLRNLRDVIDQSGAPT